MSKFKIWDRVRVVVPLEPWKLYMSPEMEKMAWEIHTVWSVWEWRYLLSWNSYYRSEDMLQLVSLATSKFKPWDVVRVLRLDEWWTTRSDSQQYVDKYFEIEREDMGAYILKWTNDIRWNKYHIEPLSTDSKGYFTDILAKVDIQSNYIWHDITTLGGTTMKLNTPVVNPDLFKTKPTKITSI